MVIHLVQFQFQIGTIGRPVAEDVKAPEIQFQFQIGTIGSLKLKSCESYDIRYFNSRLVRLEDADYCQVRHVITTFQFQIGTIGSFDPGQMPKTRNPFQFQIGTIGSRAYAINSIGVA